jgi:hypothetical protein
LSSGTNVTLTFAALPPGIYFVTVNNVKDTSVTGNPIAPNSTVQAGYAAQVVPMSGTWRYDAAGGDRGAPAVWASLGYNDSSWTGSGQGLFAAKRGVAPNGGGAAYPAMPEPVRTSMVLSNAGNATQPATYYFRTHFNSYARGSGTLTFNTILDDGAVIYLNGQEVYRMGVANNVPDAYATLANRTVGDGVLEGPFSVPITNVLGGSNVIAVSVHQINLTSSDVYWAGEFSVNVLPVVNPTTPVVVPGCSNIVWSAPVLRYQSSGTNLVLSWTNPATNTCGGNALFILQQTLALSNAMGTTPWVDVTPSSPFMTPKTNATRFFRLRK